MWAKVQDFRLGTEYEKAAAAKVKLGGDTEVKWELEGRMQQ